MFKSMFFYLVEVNYCHYCLPSLYRCATLEQDATVVSERLESAEGVLGEREGQLVQAREEIRTLTEDLKASQGKVSGLNIKFYKADSARGFPQYKRLCIARLRNFTIQYKPL